MKNCKSCTSPYRPQANGQTGRANQTSLGMLSMFSEEVDRDWDTHIPSYIFAHKTSVNPSFNETPFYLMSGQDPQSPTGVLFDGPQHR